jgi:endogenous inhibitor of DNA gyrase (YacG/DUF329 family)
MMAKKKIDAPKKLIKISREDAIAQGLDRYFTGEPCKYGDVAERDVENGACLKCRALIYETKEGGAKKERQTLSCKQCGERFKQKRNDQVFCSSTCRLEFWGATSFTRNCKHCGASFVARKNAIFCSPKCRIADWVPQLKGPDLFA